MKCQLDAPSGNLRSGAMCRREATLLHQQPIGAGCPFPT